MKRKFKLFTTLASLVVVLAVMVTGVFAATSHTLGVNTTVSFTATYVGGEVTGTVAGLTGAANYAKQTFNESTDTDLADWNVGQNCAVTATNGVPSSIVYTIDIKNTTVGAKMKVTMSNVTQGTNLNAPTITKKVNGGSPATWAPTTGTYVEDTITAATGTLQIVLTYTLKNATTSFTGGTTYGAGTGFIAFSILIERGS